MVLATGANCVRPLLCHYALFATGLALGSDGSRDALPYELMECSSR
jgi:hypothetical protein